MNTIEIICIATTTINFMTAPVAFNVLKRRRLDNAKLQRRKDAWEERSLQWERRAQATTMLLGRAIERLKKHEPEDVINEWRNKHMLEIRKLREAGFIL